MTTETAAFEATIECHDGWNLAIERLIDDGYDHRGVDSLAFFRPNSDVAIPVDDIPELIEVLQRFVDG